MVQGGGSRSRDPSKPFFSIVIPTYNRAVLLLTAIRSALGQSCGDFELIVVDDGSTDGTKTTVSTVDDGRIVYIPCRHRGVSATRNEGAAAARGRYLLFLDSDDQVDSRWLDTIYAAAIEADFPDLVICGMEARGEDGNLSWRWVPPRSGPELEDLLVHFESGQVAFRREVFNTHGGFCTELAFGENTELAIRLLVGRRPQPSVALIPEVLVYVRPAGSELDYGKVRSSSAHYVLDHHPALRQEVPNLWASYQAIVGVDLARKGLTGQARKHLLCAVVTARTREHLSRFAASLIPPVARAVWPAYGHPDSIAGSDRYGRPEVLFVAQASGLGGSMRSLATLLCHVPDVCRTVACPSPSGFTDLIESKGCVEFRLTIPGDNQGRFAGRATAALLLATYAWRRRRALVAVHANGLSERTVASLAAFVAGVPLVVWVHEWAIPPWSRRLGPLLCLLNPRTRLVAVSQQSREMLRSSGLAKSDRIEIVHNPIDADDVRAPSRSRSYSRTDVTVGFIGAPARYKGFHLLPKVIRELDCEAVEWLIYSGPRTAMPEVWAELESLQGSKVHLEDKVVDVRTAYSRFDLVVCPSEHESFGRVAAEAMMNGIPVVASDLPPLRTLLGGGQAGILVPPRDHAAMDAAIRTLVGNPSLREEMGLAGERLAAAFSPQTIARQMTALYGMPLTDN